MTNPCDCESHDEPKDDLKARLLAVHDFAERSSFRRPSSIDKWQALFARMFSAPADGSKAILRLLESLGQVGDGIVRLYTYTAAHPPTKDEVVRRYLRFERAIAEATARVFLLAQINTFRKKTSDFAPSLSGMIWAEYGSDRLSSFFCPHCEDCPCSCEIRFVPSDIDAEEVRAAAEDE